MLTAKNLWLEFTHRSYAAAVASEHSSKILVYSAFVLYSLESPSSMIQSGLKNLSTLPTASCEEQEQAATRRSRARRRSKMLLRANVKNRHSPCRKTLDSKTINTDKTSGIHDTAAKSSEVDKMDMQTARGTNYFTRLQYWLQC
jgi:hypothetical protein